jgi:DNA-binding transcriptional MerR regulator
VSERHELDLLGREPLYNTRAVVQMTDVPADTIRAWERRYGLPRPQRTPGNQRLYSEQDIGVIGWLRDRTDEGMTISRAIHRLRLEHPTIVAPPAAAPAPSPTEPDPQPARLRDRLVGAAASFDGLAGERVIDETLALFSLEHACTRVIQPALAEIGARWERGELSVAAEHFATSLIARRLSTVFNLVAPVAGRGTVVAACPPGEQHELGLLMLAIFLARRGWRVIYLGADMPLRDLTDTIRQVEPDLLCLSETTAPSAEQALQVAQQLRRASSSPAVVCGGRAFALHPSPRLTNGVHVLTGEPHDIAERIGDLIEQRARATVAHAARR